MQDNLSKRVLAILGILIVGVIGVWWVKNGKKEEEVKPEIVLESSEQMETELQLPMTDEEKQMIEDKFVSQGVEMTVLEDVVGGQAIGTAWRLRDEDGFSHKVETTGLPSLEKGFFYEGWLVGEQGFFSTGRLGLEGDKGLLYYKADDDKSEFSGVVITLEPEDGDQAPAEHVLEGSF